jgi:hypothetical protein
MCGVEADHWGRGWRGKLTWNNGEFKCKCWGIMENINVKAVPEPLLGIIARRRAHEEICWKS